MTLVVDLENNPSLQTGGNVGVMQGEVRGGFRCSKKNHHILGLADFLASLLPVSVCDGSLGMDYHT